MADTEPEASSTTNENPAASSTEQEKPLPKLSPSEFRLYNKMGAHMDLYHNHFRATWNTLITACNTGKRPAGMSIRQFLALGEQFCSQLTMHHTMEEMYIFPILAKKMPAFRKELDLLTQHKEIHKGLDKLEAYIEECRSGERELRMGELKEVLETFGEVLWQHLDDEVYQLSAENMRKYWTIEEMRQMPM
jgi:iron-sulfur cluster repair protein YtfE (RIC family)